MPLNTFKPDKNWLVEILSLIESGRKPYGHKRGS